MAMAGTGGTDPFAPAAPVDPLAPMNNPMAGTAPNMGPRPMNMGPPGPRVNP